MGVGEYGTAKQPCIWTYSGYMLKVRFLHVARRRGRAVPAVLLLKRTAGALTGTLERDGFRARFNSPMRFASDDSKCMRFERGRSAAGAAPARRSCRIPSP